MDVPTLQESGMTENSGSVVFSRCNKMDKRSRHKPTSIKKGS